jgi:hypothetical protein
MTGINMFITLKNNTMTHPTNQPPQQTEPSQLPPGETEVEIIELKKENTHLKEQLKIIRDAFYTDGETDKEKVDDLKAIAHNAIYEIENKII